MMTQIDRQAYWPACVVLFLAAALALAVESVPKWPSAIVCWAIGWAAMAGWLTLGEEVS